MGIRKANKTTPLIKSNRQKKDVPMMVQLTPVHASISHAIPRTNTT